MFRIFLFFVSEGLVNLLILHLTIIGYLLLRFPLLSNVISMFSCHFVRLNRIFVNFCHVIPLFPNALQIDSDYNIVYAHSMLRRMLRTATKLSNVIF